MRAVIPAIAVLAVAVLAGCGAGSHRDSASQPTTTAPCRHSGPLTPRQQVWFRRAQHDLQQMRKARTHARASALTDRFLNDLGRGNLPIFTANRLIDHAVYDVTAICQDCFQALEAERPIAVPQRCS